MKKLMLFITILSISMSVANAKYIPYKKLENYSFSKESGWRNGYQYDYIIVGTILSPNFNKNLFTVSISKKLYNELNTYADYKSKLKRIEWTGKNNSKSYGYKLILPISVLDKHSINIDPGMIKIYGKKNTLKVCKGEAEINEDGFIWCTANNLEDLLK